LCPTGKATLAVVITNRRRWSIDQVGHHEELGGPEFSG
jgi:hypothetical protein